MEDIDNEKILNERTNHHKGRIEEYLLPLHLNFENIEKLFGKFINNPDAIELGDKLIINGLSGGYNYALSDKFPTGQSEPLITYSIYAQRINHLASVVANIEQGIDGFTDENVTFGIKASKIRGDYKDHEPIKRQIIMKDGSVETTMESVDCVLIFKPRSIIQATLIVDFLANKAPDIEGGYIDPDLRVNATVEYKEVFIPAGTLRLGIANLYQYKKNDKIGNLIALRQETHLDEEGWDNFDNLLHPKLFEYLVIKDKSVKVNP